MQKLVAVRVDDTGELRKVTGFVNRGKNRARVWTLEILRDDKHMTKEFVRNAEKVREENGKPLGGLT